MRLTKRADRFNLDDKLFYLSINIILTIILLMVLYPLIYIISSSFSSGTAISSGKVILWPVDFSLDGYFAVFKNKDIVRSYVNSIFYTSVGTLINVSLTMIAAYPLSQQRLPGRSFFTFFFTFTMIFSGGMVPNYILIRDLNLIDSVGAMLIPGAISVYNLIIARTFIQSNIPNELLEATRIDGCSDTRYFFNIILPLSKPVIAVITLFYAVGHWNAYFNAFLYLNKRELMPLQIILREILIVNSIDPNMVVDEELLVARQGMADLLKYSLILVSAVPMLILYPFIQKYFIKGVMIGSIKE